MLFVILPVLKIVSTRIQVVLERLNRGFIEFLGEIGDIKALPILENIARDDKGRTLFGNVADAAQKAIGKIKERHR